MGFRIIVTVSEPTLLQSPSTGEYYIDDAEGMLYFYPPQGSPHPSLWPDGTVTVSVNDTALTLANTTDVEASDRRAFCT